MYLCIFIFSLSFFHVYFLLFYFYFNFIFIYYCFMFFIVSFLIYFFIALFFVNILITLWVAQLLNNIIVWMVLYCEHPLLGVKKKTKPFLHLSLAKAGPFTLESNVCLKALKCKVFQIIRCLIKPLLKNSIQTIFQGGTSWVAQLLNSIIVWMVLYCEHKLLGVKKKQNPFSTFLWVMLVRLL